MRVQTWGLLPALWWTSTPQFPFHPSTKPVTLVACPTWPWKLLVQHCAYLSFSSLSPSPSLFFSLLDNTRFGPSENTTSRPRPSYKSPIQGAVTHKAPCLLPLPASSPHHPPPHSYTSSFHLVCRSVCVCVCVCVFACLCDKTKSLSISTTKLRSTTITLYTINHHPLSISPRESSAHSPH